MRVVTSVQQGLIAQQEFAKLLMMGSRGKIEVAAPLSDDERRDYEIHVRGQYGFGLAIQVKSTMQLAMHRRMRILRSSFPVRETALVNDPYYWYFFACLDPKLMRFADPVFLVPSREVHEHGWPERRGAFWWIQFVASMEPESKDQWQRFRVDTLDLGSHALKIMRDLKRNRRRSVQAAELPSIPDVLWVAPAA